MAALRLTPLEQRLLDTVRIRGDMHGRQLAAELEADSGAVARCLVHLEELGVLRSETLGRTKLYQIPSQGETALEALVERLREFDAPRPLAVLPGPTVDGSRHIVIVLPEIWVALRSWLALRRIARRFEVPAELLVYPEREARRLARLPGNPVREALKADPDLGAWLMDPRW